MTVYLTDGDFHDPNESFQINPLFLMLIIRTTDPDLIRSDSANRVSLWINRAARVAGPRFEHRVDS